VAVRVPQRGSQISFSTCIINSARLALGTTLRRSRKSLVGLLLVVWGTVRMNRKGKIMSEQGYKYGIKRMEQDCRWGWLWEGLSELLDTLVFWLVMGTFVLAVSFIVFGFGYLILGW